MRTETTIVLEGLRARKRAEIESPQRLTMGWQVMGYRGKEKHWNPR